MPAADLRPSDHQGSAPAGGRYVPAAGRAGLTGLYDPIMRLTMREASFRPRVISALLADAPRSVLDLGCGTGTLSAGLAEADPAIHVVGIDGDEQVLRRARTKTAGFGERVELRLGTADRLPTPDRSHDAVVASLLLHHLPDAGKLAALSEARRVLRPGGRLVIADWGAPQDALMRLAFLALQLADGFANTRAHAAGELPGLIRGAGFDAVTSLSRWRTAWGSLELIAAHRG